MFAQKMQIFSEFSCNNKNAEISILAMNPWLSTLNAHICHFSTSGVWNVSFCPFGPAIGAVLLMIDPSRIPITSEQVAPRPLVCICQFCQLYL
jgi:hypothetical protein